MRYSDIMDGFHILRDGDKWLAVGPRFFDVDKNIAGFGDTPEEAFTNWRLRWEQRPGDSHLPEFGEFTLHKNELDDSP
jgi:hypothetical protein